jgi:hypothetical protein
LKLPVDNFVDEIFLADWRLDLPAVGAVQQVLLSYQMINGFKPLPVRAGKEKPLSLSSCSRQTQKKEPAAGSGWLIETPRVWAIRSFGAGIRGRVPGRGRGRFG